MQRTIRFRGKATGKGNIPTNWVYGGGCFSVAGNTFIFADPTPKFMGNGVYEAKAIEVRFICQSVGLHDIFKAEVYEGRCGTLGRKQEIHLHCGMEQSTFGFLGTLHPDKDRTCQPYPIRAN